MKKRIIISICIFFVICSITIGIVIPITTKEKKNLVLMCKWYDSNSYEDVIELPIQNVEYPGPYEYRAYIHSYSPKTENLIKQSKNYIGESSFLIDNIVQEGQLLFINNGYYFFYTVNDTYCVASLLYRFIYNTIEIDFPMSSAMYLNAKDFPLAYYLVEKHFDYTSFQKDKQFYSMFSDFVTIDEENEKIIILGNNPENQQKHEVVLDYKNKSISITIGEEVIVLQKNQS